MGLKTDLVLCFSAYHFSQDHKNIKQEITDLTSQRYRDFLTL